MHLFGETTIEGEGTQDTSFILEIPGGAQLAMPAGYVVLTALHEVAEEHRVLVAHKTNLPGYAGK